METMEGLCLKGDKFVQTCRISVIDKFVSKYYGLQKALPLGFLKISCIL